MKLLAWQKDLVTKIKKGNVITTMPRRAGKTWYASYTNVMEKPTSSFVPYDLHHRHGLMIQDYMWWTENEREILNWMEANLPEGIEHQQGMTITFDDDKQRMMFLLRWA